MQNIKLRSLFAILFSVFFLLVSSAALAARAKKEVNEYPDATRKEPKNQLSESAQKKLNKAFDLTENDNAEDSEKARQLLQEVLDAKRASDTDRAYAYQGLSQVAWFSDDAELAMEYTEKALATNALPNSAHFQMTMQLAQMKIGEELYEDSLKYVNIWLEQTGKETADALITKGNALYRLEKFDEAAAILTKAISLSTEPKSPWYQLLLASYFDQDKFDQAAEVGREMVAKFPKDKNVMMQLAAVYLDSEQDAKALALFEKSYTEGLLTEERDLQQLYQMYNFLAQPAKAVEVIKDGLASGVFSKGLEIYKALAESYVLQEDLDNAIIAYASASEYATTGEMDYQRGHLLLEKDRVQESKEALNAALAKGGYDRVGETYILLGNVALEVEDDKTAIAHYREAAKYPSTKNMAESWLKNMRQ